MPPIKRWFPVSHDINADADLWKAREQIGEKSLSIWLEFLSIADRNDGYLPGDHDQLMRQVSGKCRTPQTRVRALWHFAVTSLWLRCDPAPRVANFAKYHRTRVTNQAPSEPSEPNLPNRTEPKPPKSPKGGDVVDIAFRRFWECYPKKVNKAAAIRAWKKEAAIVREVQEKIMDALVLHKEQRSWHKDNGQYIPNPATWLNGRRWEDELIAERGTYERSIEPKGFKAIREILKEQNES